MVPSVVGFLLFGDVMASLLFERGRFTHDDSRYVWMVLSGSAVGLIATTVGRFYASAFYAMGDTKTPARFAYIRIGLVIVLGVIFGLGIPHAFGLELRFGTAGLTLSAGIAGWVEFALLRRALKALIDDFAVPVSFMARCWVVAIVAAALATGLRWALPEHNRILRDLEILVVFGVLYLGGAVVAGAITIQELRRRLRV
ncbi:MAG: lipid II flippase MurJ [Acidobacteriota bacterium]